MKNINHQKLTGEWCKHSRISLTKRASKLRRKFFKQDQEEQIKQTEK